MRVIPHRLPLLFLVLLASCGGGESAEGPGLPQGPPRWRAVAGPSLATGAEALVEARTPCRITVRCDEAALALDAPRADLAAGEVLRFSWSQEILAPRDSGVAPPPEEAAAGRTAGWTVVQRVAFQDRAVWHRTATVWARPGLGRSLERLAAPPILPAELPFGGEAELAAAAVSDYARGEASIRPKGGRSRLDEPRPAAPGDRGSLLRLWLEIEPR